MKPLEGDNATSQEAAAGKRPPTAGQFLEALSHQFRLPLNAIVETADLLAEIPLSPEHVECISALRDSADRLAVLLDNLFNLSEFETVDRSANTRFDLAAVVRGAVRAVSRQAAAKGLTVESKTAAQVPLFVSGDSNRLKRTLADLLRIAVTFGERGSVVLTVAAEAVPGEVSLRFTVAYDGAAPAEDSLDSIGLSLAACCQRAYQMGGRLWVEVVPGGSHIQFTASLEAANGLTDTSAVRVAGLRILVADGDAASRTLVRQMLVSFGAVPVEAPSGASALYELQHGDYAAMIWNAGSAASGGRDFLAHVKHAAGQKRLAMVAIGPHFSAEERRWYLEAGTESCLVRPLCKGDLLEALRYEMGKPEIREARDPEPVVSQRSDGACHILLVDGAPRCAAQARGFLKHIPHQLEYAQDASSALEMFQSRKYDLVFMDVQMPRVDGRQAARLIRVWEQENNRVETPIVSLAAHDLEHGEPFNGSIGKPLKKAEFIEAVSRYGCGQIPTPPNREIPEALRHLVPEYLHNQKAELEAVRFALTKLDVRPVRMFAQHLMGSGPAFGFTRLAALGQKLELAGRMDNWKGVRHCLADIDSCLSGVAQKSHKAAPYSR